MIKIVKCIGMGANYYRVTDNNGREKGVMMHDDEISRCIGMKIEDYRNKMREFGASIVTVGKVKVVFYDKEDAEKALKWITPIYEPHYIMAKIAGWRDNE